VTSPVIDNVTNTNIKGGTSIRVQKEKGTVQLFIFFQRCLQRTLNFFRTVHKMIAAERFDCHPRLAKPSSRRLSSGLETIILMGPAAGSGNCLHHRIDREIVIWSRSFSRELFFFSNSSRPSSHTSSTYQLSRSFSVCFSSLARH
jgi:hypothetical protein